MLRCWVYAPIILCKIHVHVYVHVHVHICMHVQYMNLYVHICTCERFILYMYVHVHVRTCTCTYMQHSQVINQIAVDEEGEFIATAADDGKVCTFCMHTHVRTCTCVCIVVYICMYAKHHGFVLLVST